MLPYNPFPPEFYHQSALALPPQERIIDLENMFLSSFLHYETEFLITLHSEPTVTMWNNEDEERHMTTVSFGISFVNPEEESKRIDVPSYVTKILDRWQSEQIPLRFATTEPGGNIWGILAESPTIFLPVPTP